MRIDRDLIDAHCWCSGYGSDESSDHSTRCRPNLERLQQHRTKPEDAALAVERSRARDR